MAYLYGSAIQGIQSFIFETNKLKEIIGASEIVEQLSYEKFNDLFNLNEENFIMHAAGNIKLIIKEKETVERIVRMWPKAVEEMAPSLTLSQAVVNFGERLRKKHIDFLEKRLQISKNKAAISQPLSLMAVTRSRRTGKPAIDWNDYNNKPRDIASKLKQDKGHNEAPQNLMSKSINDKKIGRELYPFDISDMLLEGEDTGWLAVIHADGNSLGKIIQGMAEKLQENGDNLKEAFKKFSKALDESTINAVKCAVEQIVIPNISDIKNTKLPFRPVVIGGDDLTIIIRADLALEFTERYLVEFQSETKKNLKNLVETFKLQEFDDGLTACAGISYMKVSYPFHYAVNLAENLCADAKKVSKEINKINVPTSISFHKIQDSFVDTYDEIKERELTPQNNISFKFGPYGINEDKLPSIANLKEQLKEILKKDAPKSGIRKWLKLLHEDANKADLWFKRVYEITTENFIEKLKLKEAVKNNKTHLYDVLSLASISRENIKGGV